MTRRSLGTTLPTAALLALFAWGCSDSKEQGSDAGMDGSPDADADTDADTDADADADTDADTDADADADTDADADAGPALELDLDCSDPVEVPSDLCNLVSNPCDEGAVCSELFWQDEPIYPLVVANYCFPGCAAEPADAGPDAGAFDPCAGSNTACVELAEGVEGCVPLGQIKAAFDLVVTPVGQLPAASDFQFVSGFSCGETIAFLPGAAFQIGEEILDAGAPEDAGPSYTTDAITFYWVRPKAIGNPYEYRLNVSIPADGWYDGAVLDLAEDPAAFQSWLVQIQYEFAWSDVVTNAWIEAVATAGQIVVEHAADPCSGEGCEPATGTMDVWYQLRRAELDPSLFE